MKYGVFIQTNHKQIVGAIVAEHAIRRYSAHNDKFDIQIVDSRDCADQKLAERLTTVVNWAYRGKHPGQDEKARHA